MDITQIIAHNLREWMNQSPELTTLKKVAARSGVGFGTVQRMRNGDGNTTIQNLESIAHAFKRRVTDLLIPMPEDYERRASAEEALGVREPAAVIEFHRAEDDNPVIKEVVRLLLTMDEHHRSMAAKMVRLLADQQLEADKRRKQP